MPFADYPDFETCVARNQDKDDPEAYCAAIKRQVEGKLSGPLGWAPHGETVWSEDQGYLRLEVQKVTRPRHSGEGWRWVITDRISEEPEWGYAPTRGAAREAIDVHIREMLNKAARRTAAPFPPKPKPPGAAAPEEVVDPTGVPTPPGAPPAPQERQSDKVVYVCPFCGSGGIYGSADGTITCTHDNVRFTVEVKPAHPSMPLVDENGQPFKPSVQEGMEYPEIGQAQPPPPQGGDEAVEESPFPPEEDEEGDDDLPAFLKGSMFITAEGVALSGDEYVTYLAERHLR